jgi:hypothetical protein
MRQPIYTIRKESRVGVARRRHRLLYKRSRIQKWQKFPESDRRGVYPMIAGVAQRTKREGAQVGAAWE